MSRFDDKLRQCPAKAIVDTLRKVDAVRCAEQVEIPLVVPVAHDGETVEQRNIVLLRHHAHVIQVGRRRNHRFRARAILQIHQDHVGSRILQRSNSFADCGTKIVGIDGSHSIDGAGLPDNQSRLFGFQQLGEPAGDLIVTFQVQPDRFFRRDGLDIVCEVPINLAQALLGSRIRVRTLDGKKVVLKIPPGTQSGRKFRIKGLGIERNGRRGDQLVEVYVKLPEHLTAEEQELVKKLAELEGMTY